MDRLAPGNAALNVALRWRLEGCVTGANLNLAFSAVIARHPALRCFFAEEDGSALRIIEPSLSFRIMDIDLRALSASSAEEEADRIARREARTPFNLSALPLLRVTRLRLGEQVSILLLTAHQIVCDRDSAAMIAREVCAVCAALEKGRPAESALPPLVEGSRAARWARSLPPERLRRDEAYWMERLKGLRYFELHPERPRLPLQTYHSGQVWLPIERGLTDGLMELAARSGCTLYMAALTGLFAALHRYSGETDISIGSPVAVREKTGTRGAIGPHPNTILVRGDVSGDPTFLELLLRMRGRVMEDFAHLSTSLERVIERINPHRDLSRNALFSVQFEFRRERRRPLGSAGLMLVDLPPCPAGALYDLNLVMVEHPDGWRLGCEYKSDLFEAGTASRLLEHIVNLLRAAVDHPSQRVSTMPMIDPVERRALIEEGNQTAAAYPRESTVVQLFVEQVQRCPEAIALVCGTRSLSYRELDGASNRLAHQLQDYGIGRGSRVGICLERSPDLLVALLAVLKSGAAYVPLDPAYPVARLAQIVEDARPMVLLTRRGLRERLPEDGPAILIDADAAAIASQPDTAVMDPARGDDLAYVIFTSGSTGRPKGVQIPHRALTNFLWAMRREPGLDASDTLLSVTTVSFDIAALELFLPLIVGARLILAQGEESIDGVALLRLLRGHAVTVMQATPVTWQMLLAAGWRADPPLKMLCGGEALSRNLADRLLAHGGELWNLYGPTETTIWSSALRVVPGKGPVPIGPPIANTQFHVLDAHGQLIPAGVPGELYIGGDGVAVGYLKLPLLTAERFVEDRFSSRSGARLYRTGDRVCRRADGELEFLGRADHQIKLRGFRIELGEIETVLRAQPQVADCVAVVATAASGEPAIHAYVVATATQPLRIEDLQSRLRDALPAYMCPSAIQCLDALPRTPNGKLDRAALPAPALPEALPAGERWPPLGETELCLMKIWSEVLGVSELDEHSNFFELGGHSLLAVRLLVRIEAEFGLQLSLATLFRYPRLVEQARLLTDVDGSAAERAFDFRQVLKLQPHGSQPPLLALNNTGIYYALSRRLGADQPFTSLQLFDPSLPQAVLPRTLEEIAAGYLQLIRRVQPQGPYALLGWCVAGTLAFEVARQLVAAGEKVSKLVLFDTLVPGYLQRLPWMRARLADYSYRWKLILADWKRTPIGPRRLQQFLGNRLTVQMLTRQLQRLGVLGATAEPAIRRPQQDPELYDQWLLQFLQEAADAYEPRPYSGRLTLFRSSEEPMGRFLDLGMGWGEFAEGGVEVVVVTGDHFSVFQEPGISRIAGHIESGMDRRHPDLPQARAYA